MTVNVNSSILVEELVGQPAGGPATVTCGYTNLPATDLAPPDYTNECPEAGAPGSTNTDLFPEQMFFGSDPSARARVRLEPAAGSPAVDGGQPGPVPPRLLDDRLRRGPAARAGDGGELPHRHPRPGRDRDAAVSCSATLAVSPTGTGSGTVTGPGINCGGGTTDCSETVAVGSDDRADGDAGRRLELRRLRGRRLLDEPLHA